MKRQRGRNRGGGGGGGGGKPQPQNANRAFDSNGPEGVKVRGNAQHVFEKYQQLARDASAAGDRVLGENYLQHAEHYFRLLRAMQPQRPASEILGRDHFSSGFDIDFEDEGAQAQALAADEASAEAGDTPESVADAAREQQRWQGGDRPQQRDDRPRDDRPRDDRQRDDRQRDDRPRGDRDQRFEGRDGQQGGRRDRWRDERPRDDRPRDDRPRDDRPRDDRPRDDRQRDDRPRFERSDRDPMAVVEPQAAPLVAEERPERPERPARAERAPRAERPARVLRDAEGGESHAPAFLQAPAATPRPESATDEDGQARKPRRRRAPRTFEGGEGPPPSSEAEDA
jgi:hypothetical protein